MSQHTTTSLDDPSSRLKRRRCRDFIDRNDARYLIYSLERQKSPINSFPTYCLGVIFPLSTDLLDVLYILF